MKTCKKNMAIVLSFVLAAASIAMPSTESKAAKMKLNKSSVTVAVGKKVSLKVKGTTKKVRWTTSKKAIASVSKKGVVTGKKAGKATITAKVGAKKFRCKVTVKKSSKVKNVSTTKLASKCSFTVKKYKKGVLICVKNNNSQTIDELRAVYTLKTSSGKVIETGRDGFDFLEAGKTRDIVINLEQEQLSVIDTSKTVVKCYVNQEAEGKHYKNINKYISQSMSETFNEATGVDSFNCKVTNTSSKYVEVSMYLYFYDESGNIVNVCNFNGMSLNPKEKNNQLFDGPCIDNGNNGYTKGYKSYKFVMYAHDKRIQ